MGAIMAKPMQGVMEENMKKQQEFMLASQRMQVERQQQMQLQLRQRMIATQLAATRERMYWWGSFLGVATLSMTGSYAHTRHPAVFLPLIPLSFVVGYQADMAWGNKMNRIIAEADKILAEEQHLLALPGRPLSVDLLDEERRKTHK